MIEWHAALGTLKWLRSLKGLPSVIKGGRELLKEERRARWADRLADLAFWADGLIAPLDAVANGKGTSSDLQSLRDQLRKTDFTIEASTASLRHWRAEIARELGMDVARGLSSLIKSKGGTGGIRHQIFDLANREGIRDPETMRIADEILREIGEFNRALDEIHEKFRDAGRNKEEHKHQGNTPRARRRNPAPVLTGKGK